MDGGEGERLLEEGSSQGLPQAPPHIEDELDSFLCRRVLACFGYKGAPELSEAERDALWHLRRHVVNNPVPGSEELQGKFVAIWNAAFPERRADTFETGEHWKGLGFQGRDPTTDVRTGYWPLEQLDSIARQHPADFREMVTNASAKSSEYLFAISCFNCSHMLSMFFDLYTSPSVSPLANAKRATKRQLKHFARLIVQECHANGVDMSVDICKRVLNELNFEVVRFTHCKWMEMATSRDNITLMNFPEALRQGFDTNANFWQHPCDNLGELRME